MFCAIIIFLLLQSKDLDLPFCNTKWTNELFLFVHVALLTSRTWPRDRLLCFDHVTELFVWSETESDCRLEDVCEPTARLSASVPVCFCLCIFFWWRSFDRMLPLCCLCLSGCLMCTYLWFCVSVCVTVLLFLTQYHRFGFQCLTFHLLLPPANYRERGWEEPC